MTKLARLHAVQFQPTSVIRLFGSEWMRSPLRVGAVAPSSEALARAITLGVSGASGPVIELGPGTGIFTSALLDRGVLPDRIAAIEAGEGFAVALERRYPDVNVICGDAARVRHVTPFGVAGAAFIICGLPLLSMPPAKVLRILSGSLAALMPGGELRLFTYGPRCPVSSAMRARLGLVARRTAFVPLNIPPATVYTLQRQECTA